VLRPGGSLLFADMRTGRSIPALRRQLTAPGMALMEEEDITPNVLRALDLDNDRKIHLIRRRVPQPLRGLFCQFAGTQGTWIYESLSAGHTVYWRCVLRKTAPGPGDPAARCFVPGAFPAHRRSGR
ncbi:MAG: hypothetical protein HY660_00590, partial [Armatimonadetes bacterium]|nr:hypothetical protein [Armatimonadota bacterium]